MAKPTKRVEAKEPINRVRRRLSAEQTEQLSEAIRSGETGPSIAARLGTTTATVYAHRRKILGVGSQIARPDAAGQLRKRLTSFAVRTLLGHDVPSSERTELEGTVREEITRRLAQGI